MYRGRQTLMKTLAVWCVFLQGGFLLVTASDAKGEVRFHVKEFTKVRDNQRSLVIVTHGFVELLLNSVIDAKCKLGKTRITSNTRDYSHSVKLVLLSELGMLDDKLYKILDWFRKLRNRAAHKAFFMLTHTDLDFVNRSMGRFLPGNIEPLTGDLYRFCTLLIGTVWNGYLDVFLAAFEPAQKEAQNH